MSATHIEEMKKKLQSAILSVQSDEIINQMRNDESLYEYKMLHIRQLIKDELHLEEDIHDLSLENEELKRKYFMLEQNNRKMSEEYVTELDNIDAKWKQFIDEKEREKKEYFYRHQQEINILREEVLAAKKELTVKTEQIRKIKIQNQNLKQDRKNLERSKADLEDVVRKNKRENEEKLREVQRNLRDSFEQKTSKEASDYEQIIGKMQRDMYLIKESWEKKCYELQNQLKEESHVIALEIEERYKREFKEHAQSLKLGNSVVISDSEEVISRRVELIEGGYKEQIRRAEEEIRRLQEGIKEVRQDIENLQETNKQMKSRNKSQEQEIEKLERSIEIKDLEMTRLSDSHKREIERHQSQLTRWKEQYQEAQLQVKQRREQNSILNKKLMNLENEIYQSDEEVSNLKNKVGSLNSTIEEHLSTIINSKSQLIQKDQTINAQKMQIDNIKENLNNVERLLKNEKEKNEELHLQTKKTRQNKKRLLNKLDKAHLNMRKLQKDQQLLREQVSCAHEMLKNRLSIDVSKLAEQFNQVRDGIQRRYRQKMSQLLDDMEGKENDLVDTMRQEKEVMKTELKEYQFALQKREEELTKLRHFLGQLERDKRDLLEDLEKQKLISMRFEEQIETNEHAYSSNLVKVQKDVARCLANFNSKWTDQIGKVQEELENRDLKIKNMADVIDSCHQEKQENKKQQQWIEQEVKKYKKKYENLKSQRDDKVETLLKKLDQQNKQRLNLERELKQVRMTIMKGTYQNNNTNFSFNDKQMFTTAKSYSGKEEQSREREKELSEIRDMIAKTYKVVGDNGFAPERDVSRNISKRALF